MNKSKEALEKLRTQFESVENFGNIEERDGLKYLDIIEARVVEKVVYAVSVEQKETK